MLAVLALWPTFTLPADLVAQQRSERSAEPDSVVLVEGKVVDHDTDGALQGATVSLGAGPSGLRGRGTRVTNGEGRFLFRDVPAGAYRLYVTNPGYRGMSDTLEVSAEGDLDLILPLSTETIHLEPIVVTVERPPMAMRGIEGRQRRRGGFLVTREEILRRRPRYLTELLHSVPGGMVVPSAPAGYTLLLRGQCRPGIWVDGVRMQGANSIDQLLSPHDVQAVEVFHGFELPVEFGVDACGGVLIWTRIGNPPSTDADSEVGSSALASLFGAALVALLVVVLVK